MPSNVHSSAEPFELIVYLDWMLRPDVIYGYIVRLLTKIHYLGFVWPILWQHLRITSEMAPMVTVLPH